MTCIHDREIFRNVYRRIRLGLSDVNSLTVFIVYYIRTPNYITGKYNNHTQIGKMSDE